MSWLSLLLFLLVCGVLLILLIIGFLALLYLLPMARGAVYVPSKPVAIAAMIKLGKVGPGRKVAELGSGDGRVVIALAQTGAEVHGYEINPLLVWQARRAIRRVRLHHRAFIHQQSYWDADLGVYDVITVYGITYIMKALGEKLRAELPPGSRVVSNYFKFPHWKSQKNEAGVFLYRC